MIQPDRQPLNPDDFIITRKRKLYKFAVFQNMSNCYDDQTWPEHKDSFITSANDLVVEIGAGTAMFLNKLAAINPQTQFLAIDRKSDRLYKGAKYALENNINNITYLWSNVRNISSLLPIKSVNQIWITFPDPWPQESNVKHRLTNPKFLAQYHKLLKQGGVLNFKTDNTPLFDWSVEQFDNKLWKIEHCTHNLHNNDEASDDAKITTTYEERYINEGKTINYLRATKIDD